MDKDDDRNSGCNKGECFANVFGQSAPMKSSKDSGENLGSVRNTKNCSLVDAKFSTSFLIRQNWGSATAIIAYAVSELFANDASIQIFS